MPPRYRNLKTTSLLSETRPCFTPSTPLLRKLKAFSRKKCSASGTLLTFFLVVATLFSVILSRSKPRACSSSDALPYKFARKQSCAVVLGPGVAQSIHLRVLLERVSGAVTTSDGSTAFCLHDKCPTHTKALATFLDAEYLHLADPDKYNRVVAIAMSPVDAIYTEALLASVVHDETPKRRISLDFAQFHIKLYKKFVKWVAQFPAKLVRLEDLVKDEALGGAKGVWVDLAHFLDERLTEKLLAKKVKCAFNKEGIQAETPLRLVPPLLYGRTANRTRFDPRAWNAVAHELVDESCAFGFNCSSWMMGGPLKSLNDTGSHFLLDGTQDLQ